MSSSYMAMWCRQMFSSSPVTLIRRVSDRRRTMRSSFWRTSSLTNTGRRLTILGTCRKVARYSSRDNLRCLLLTRRVTVGNVVSGASGGADVTDRADSFLAVGERESSSCPSSDKSARGLASELGAGITPWSVCFSILAEKSVDAALKNSLSSACVKSFVVFFILNAFIWVTTMVRVCTADRLSCAKVVCLLNTAKRLGLDAPFCACFEKNDF